MGKKDNTPFLLKLVRWFFPRLEKFFPPLAHRYFLKIFFTPLKYTTPEKELVAEKFARKFTLEAAGKTIQCYEWGEEKDPYVLLVHGWAGRATQFRRFIKPLMNSGMRVVGFDGPAHGASSGKRTSINEFEETLRKMYQVAGEPQAIIAHSFGGVATLYSAMNGLPIRKLVNIASPTIGDEVIRTYLNAVNGSWSTGEFFKSYVLKTTGKTFDEFSALHFVKHLPRPIDLLLVHDENDKEVAINHAEALLNIYSHAHLLRTRKLGHTRILKDDEVIRRCVTFARDGASGRNKW
jgi:predicted alpha/beta hydrolase family esterase